MSKIICEKQDLVDIANAIRAKNGKTNEFSIYQMPDEITSISGTKLPSLSNSGVSGDLAEGKQLIDADGNVVIGTFTIDSELTTQDNLISQIQSAVDNLPEAGGEPNLQTKTVTPTTSSQNVIADSGFDGLSEVIVNAIPTATQATPSISINSSGLITASATQTAGYVSAGTKSGTKQLTTQAAKTVTPSTSEQTAVASDVYTTGAVKVAAIPDTYVKPSATKGATTYTPATSDQTISAGTYCSGIQTIKGDANLKASNIVSGVSIFGVTGTYVGSVESGGDASLEDALIAINMSSYVNNHATDIGQGAFAFASNLQYVSFPAATTIGNSAFYSCSKLVSVDFQTAININDYAFNRCKSLTTLNFPEALSIGNAAFQSCSALTNVSFPKVTTIDTYAFGKCPNLNVVNFPSAITVGASAFGSCSSLGAVGLPIATTIGNNAFQACSNLTLVSFPKVTTINTYAFTNCSKLTTVSLPELISMYSNAFANCFILSSISLPKVTTIASNAFYGCSSLNTARFSTATTISSSAFTRCFYLKSLYLTSSSICKLSHSNAFSSTPIGGYSTSARTYGSIYVPASLLASYKTATNWTYFSSRFVGI